MSTNKSVEITDATNDTAKTNKSVTDAAAVAQKLMAERRERQNQIASESITAHTNTAQAGAGEIAKPKERNTPTANTGEKKLSPKAKESRGVPEDYKSAWVDVNFPPEVHAMFTKAVKTRGTSIVDLFREICEDKMKDEEWMKAIKADADKAPEPKSSTASLEGKSVDQLQAQADKAMKDLEKLRAALALKLGNATKSAQASITPAVETTPDNG